MSNQSKPAWGSYADLKRIQREREQREREQQPAEVVAQTGHPQTGHPNSGHPQTGHPISAEPGTQTPGTQSPTNRAPGHPEVGARVPEARAPNPEISGHPISTKPGTQKAPSRPKPAVVAPESTALRDGAESPFWPSRKFKTRLNLRFPGDLSDQLDEYCRTNGLSKQDAAEIAIRRMLSDDRSSNRAPNPSQTGHPQTGHPQLWVPESAHDHDDDEDDRIIIYQQMTGNRVNARDRAAFAEIRHLHTDVIREGIRLSVERAPAPVKSFRYCLGAILEVASRSSSTSSAKKPPAPETTPGRTYDESVLLARAVVRQLRHDRPTIADADLRASLLAWAQDQGVRPGETIVEAALAAEGLAG